MKKGKRVVQLEETECGILIRCLNDKRTELIQQDKDTDVVDELLLKVIDAPTRKSKREREYAER